MILKQILKIKTRKYPDMPRRDASDLDELFHKIVFGDYKRYPASKELEYGVGEILKRIQRQIMDVLCYYKELEEMKSKLKQ